MSKLITRAEYARLRGVSRVAVGKAVKTGRIDLVDGLIDPIAADAQWERNTRKSVGRGGRPAMDKLIEIWKNAPAADRSVEYPPPGAQVAGDSQPQTSHDYEASRAKREHHEAWLSMMRAQERARQLVESSQVLEAVGHITSLLCEGLDSLPGINSLASTSIQASPGRDPLLSSSRLRRLWV